jgi:hypothetical protein
VRKSVARRASDRQQHRAEADAARRKALAEVDARA